MATLHEFPFDSKPPEVLVTPEVDPWLTITTGRVDGTAQASIHRSRVAQQHDREQAIAAVLERESDDLLSTQLLDSLTADRVATHIPGESYQERHDAAAVAIRLHDPRWQIVSRYEAADAILVALRSSQAAHGWYLPDSELRKLADHLAAVSHRARLKVWTGQVTVTARQWAKAALGFLSVVEER